MALPGWIALFVSPWIGRPAIRVARTVGILLALAYLALFLFNPQGAGRLAVDYSLQGIGALFAEPRLLLLGWVHYLAFDLWVATWESEEGRTCGIAPWLLLPCLVLTIALGPLGLLLFLLVRRLARRRRTK